MQGETFIENMLWRGITKGIYNDFSGRMTVDHMLSDFYRTGIEIHHSYDVDRIYDVHEWGFNNDGRDQTYYKSHNGSLIHLYRADSPFIDNVFSINMSSGITFDTDAAGTSTSGVAMAGGVAIKVQIGKLILLQQENRSRRRSSHHTRVSGYGF